MGNLGTRVLEAARQAGHSVIGVTIRDPRDRATWHLQYRATTTPEQQAVTNAWLAQFDPDVAQDDEDREAFDEQRWLKALVIWAAQRFNVSLSQARKEILTVYRRLNE